jgi:hypothetical protein
MTLSKRAREHADGGNEIGGFISQIRGDHQHAPRPLRRNMGAGKTEGDEPRRRERMHAAKEAVRSRQTSHAPEMRLIDAKRRCRRHREDEPIDIGGIHAGIFKRTGSHDAEEIGVSVLRQSRAHRHLRHAQHSGDAATTHRRAP